MQYTFGLTRLVGHGHAFTQLVRPTSPAAGVGFTYTVDSRYWEMIDSLSFQLVTDGNAADRLVTLTINDGNGVPIATVPAAAALTASKTGLYTYLGTLSTINGATDGPFASMAPQVFLQPTYTVTVGITGVQVGDQVSKIRLYVQRFVTGNEGYLLGVYDTSDPQVERFVKTASLLA